jgi:hypothetical protein
MAEQQHTPEQIQKGKELFDALSLVGAVQNAVDAVHPERTAARLVKGIHTSILKEMGQHE